MINNKEKRQMFLVEKTPASFLYHHFFFMEIKIKNRKINNEKGKKKVQEFNFLTFSNVKEKLKSSIIIIRM